MQKTGVRKCGLLCLLVDLAWLLMMLLVIIDEDYRIVLAGGVQCLLASRWCWLYSVRGSSDSMRWRTRGAARLVLYFSLLAYANASKYKSGNRRYG